MKKINISAMEVKGIDGKVITFKDVKINEAVGNALYAHSMSVPVAELGTRIYKGEEVEFREEEMKEVKAIINSDEKLPLMPFIKRQLLEFIEK